MAATSVTATKSTRVTNLPQKPVAGALAASDATEGNTFTNTGREIIVVSTGTTATRTITFYDVNGTEPRSVGHIVNACQVESERFECLAVLALEQMNRTNLKVGDPEGPPLEKLPLPYSLTD